MNIQPFALKYLNVAG